MGIPSDQQVEGIPVFLKEGEENGKIKKVCGYLSYSCPNIRNYVSSYNC
jgi:hypothetical protein